MAAVAALAVAVLAAGSWAGSGSTAGAHGVDVPLGVTSIAVTPDPPGGVTLRTGGFFSIQLTADAGTDVVVYGTAGEPYLWIRPDGSTLENRRSATWWANRDPYGPVGPPPSYPPGTDPQWEPHQSAGGLLWYEQRAVTHDHDNATPDTSWEIPISVDGERFTIAGQSGVLTGGPTTAAVYAAPTPVGRPGWAVLAAAAGTSVAAAAGVAVWARRRAGAG